MQEINVFGRSTIQQCYITISTVLPSGSNLSCLGFNAVFNSDCITIYHYVPHDSNQLYLNNKHKMTFK